MPGRGAPSSSLGEQSRGEQSLPGSGFPSSLRSFLPSFDLEPRGNSHNVLGQPSRIFLGTLVAWSVQWSWYMPTWSEVQMRSLVSRPWVLILAGGDGLRLRALTRQIAGDLR